MTKLRGKTAIVATAESDLGLVAPDTSIFDLMGQATHRALVDCGLKLSDIDGIFAAASQSRMVGLGLAEYLGVHPTYVDTTSIGGSSFMAHISHAQAAIEAGLCEVALIAYGSTQRSVSRAAASAREVQPFEDPYKPMMPPSAYAMAASRHMHEYGTTREQLAQIAVAARQWALMNPVAWEKEPLSVEDVLGARMISHPFTVRDCCLVTDGGGAIILTTAERARDLAHKPAYVLGTGSHITHQSISNMPDFTTSGAVESGQRAYAMAGVAPGDVDAAELYDAFTICTLLFLEDLGFCAKGEGGAFVDEGGIAPGGRFPVNTNGGGLSYCHPGMYGLLVLIEAARQIHGVCGPRQVEGAQVVLAHGNGGVLSSQCTVILGAGSTL